MWVTIYVRYELVVPDKCNIYIRIYIYIETFTIVVKWPWGHIQAVSFLPEFGAYKDLTAVSQNKKHLEILV